MSTLPTNTGHGHVTPRSDGVKARCGGPGFCSVCNAEQALLRAPVESTDDARKFLIGWSRTHFKDKTFTDYITNDLAGDFAFNLATALRAQEKPAAAAEPSSLDDYEHRKAIQEGHQNAKSDAYFAARHHMLDSTVSRNVFRAGFDRGWDAALEEKGGA